MTRIPPTQHGRHTVGEDAVRASVRALERLAEADPAFAGVSMNASARQLVLFRVGGSSGVLAEAISGDYISAVAPGVGLEIRNAVLSRAQASVLDGLVESHESILARANITLQAWGTLDGWGSPYIIEYSGDGSFPDDVGRDMSRFGTGSFLARRGKTISL